MNLMIRVSYHRVTEQKIIARDFNNKLKATEEASKALLREKEDIIAQKSLDLQKAAKNIEIMKSTHEDMLNAALLVITPDADVNDKRKVL